jgi:DNA-binding MarR family transcriptional regulator
MKDIIKNLNKVFDNRVRLGIMAILVVNEWVEFKELKTMLGVTDGNLASHISSLEKKELLEVRKMFVSRKPQTSYRVTALGQQAFQEHLDALESIISMKKTLPETDKED